MKKCKCGCGVDLYGKADAVWAYRNVCRPRYYNNLMMMGCLPATEIRFKNCSKCGAPFAHWKSARRRTCTAFYGETCQGKDNNDKRYNNKHGNKNRGKSHAPVFKKRNTLPEVNGEIGAAELRNIAASLLMSVYKSISKRKVDILGTNWQKDVRWIHDPESDYRLWCQACDFWPGYLQKKFPRNLVP